MDVLLSRLRGRLDRFGVVLSALCVVHCVSGLVLVTVLGLSGGVLLSPRIHEVGLAAAIVIGGIGLGFGVARHGRRDVAALGVGGLGLMALGLVVPDGAFEAAITIAGVSLVATAHIRNLRHVH